MLNKLTSPIGSILLFIVITVSAFYFSTEKAVVRPVDDSPTAALFASIFPDENSRFKFLGYLVRTMS